MTFEQQWEAARFNSLYWLSYAAMWLVSAAGSLTIGFLSSAASAGPSA